MIDVNNLPKEAFTSSGRKVTPVLFKDGLVFCTNVIVHCIQTRDGEDDYEELDSSEMYGFKPQELFAEEKEVTNDLMVQVRLLKDEVREQQHALNLIKRQIYLSQVERDSLKRYVETHPQLKFLTEFLNGKYKGKWVVVQSLDTQYLKVRLNHMYMVRKTEEFMQESYSHLKLLTLFGDSKGDLSWRVSNYSDGSGNQKEVNFFSTEKECFDFIKTQVELQLKDPDFFVDMSHEEIGNVISYVQGLGIEYDPSQHRKTAVSKKLEYLERQLQTQIKEQETREARQRQCEEDQQKLKESIKELKQELDTL